MKPDQISDRTSIVAPSSFPASMGASIARIAAARLLGPRRSELAGPIGVSKNLLTQAILARCGHFGFCKSHQINRLALDPKSAAIVVDSGQWTYCGGLAVP